jgi:hypothetical protein
MKKSVLSFLAFILAFNFLIAQKNYEKSPAFDEFEGWTKLVQLRNNNTGLLELTKKEGVSFTLFDPSRKKISSKKLQFKQIPEKLGSSYVEGVYDINGDFVFFLYVIAKTGENKDELPTLFRVILDGSTGQIKSEDVLGELEAMNMGNAYAIAFGDVDAPEIFVEKDPESDYYAVIRYNSFAAETNRRIEVMHYGPDHKIINRGFYNTLSDKYKFTKYLSAYVKKDEYVLIGTYAFNTKKSGGEEARYYVSQLPKGKTTFIQKELAFTEFCKKASCSFVYNKPKGIINMIIVPEATFFGASYAFQNINPTTMQLDKPYNVDLSQVNQYYKEALDNKKDFSGGIYNTMVDKEGNLVILFQTCRFRYESQGPGIPAQIVSTTLGTIALITISPEGKTLKSSILPYSVFRMGDKRSFSYLDVSKGKKPPFQYAGGLAADWYFNVNMVSTDKSTYLFLNNVKDNVEKAPDENPKTIKGISGASGMKYTLESGVLKGQYIFGTPEGKKDAKFANFSSSDYNPVTKTFATIMVDPEEKKSNVIWMKLD